MTRGPHVFFPEELVAGVANCNNGESTRLGLPFLGSRVEYIEQKPNSNGVKMIKDVGRL